MFVGGHCMLSTFLIGCQIKGGSTELEPSQCQIFSSLFTLFSCFPRGHWTWMTSQEHRSESMTFVSRPQLNIFSEKNWTWEMDHRNRQMNDYLWYLGQRPWPCFFSGEVTELWGKDIEVIFFVPCPRVTARRGWDQERTISMVFEGLNF